MDVVQSAIQLQCEADALLEESKLISHLESFGSVSVVGSYQYRLMTIADIDLYVTSPDAGRDQAKAILVNLIDQGFWRGFLLEDWVQFQHVGFPSGFYVGLKRTFRDRLWKIDIWNLNEIPQDLLAFSRSMSRLTEAQRQTILEIKNWRDSNFKKIQSKVIYDAILSKKAHDLESFLMTIEK